MTKTFDISDDLKAIENRGRELRTKQKNAIGETVIATGAEKKLTANQLAGLLLDALERAKTDPAVKKKWEEIGEAFFRRKSAAGNGAANRKNGGGDASTSKQVKPPRGAPPPTSEAPDLLTRAQTE
jgi:DNA-binding protein H-NS